MAERVSNCFYEHDFIEFIPSYTQKEFWAILRAPAHTILISSTDQNINK